MASKRLVKPKPKVRPKVTRKQALEAVDRAINKYFKSRHWLDHGEFKARYREALPLAKKKDKEYLMWALLKSEVARELNFFLKNPSKKGWERIQKEIRNSKAWARTWGDAIVHTNASERKTLTKYGQTFGKKKGVKKTSKKKTPKKKAKKAPKKKAAPPVVVGKMGRGVASELRGMTKQQYADVAYFFKLHYGEVESFEQAKTGKAPKFMTALTQYDRVLRNSMLTNLFEKKATRERASTDAELENTLEELRVDAKVFGQMKELGFVSGRFEGSSHSTWGRKEKDTGTAYLNGIYNQADGSVWRVRYRYQRVGEEKVARIGLGASSITRYDKKGKVLWELNEADLRVRDTSTLKRKTNGEVTKENLTVLEYMSFNMARTALMRSGKNIDGYFGLYNYDTRTKIFGWTRRNRAGNSLVRFYGDMNNVELLGRINNKYRYIQGTPEWVAQWVTANSTMLSAVPRSSVLKPVQQLTRTPGTIGGYAPLNSTEFGRYNVYIKGRKLSLTKIYDRTPIKVGDYTFKVVYEESIGGRNYAYVTMSKGGKDVTNQFTVETATGKVTKPTEIEVTERDRRTSKMKTVKTTVLRTEIGEALKLNDKKEKFDFRLTYSGTQAQELAESEIVYSIQINSEGTAKSIYLKQGDEIRMAVGAHDYVIRLESVKVGGLSGTIGKIRDLTIRVSDVSTPNESKERVVNLQVGEGPVKLGRIAIPEFGMNIHAEMAAEHMQRIPMNTLTLASGLAVIDSNKVKDGQWLTRSLVQMSGRTMGIVGETMQFGKSEGQGGVVAAAGFLDLKEKGMQAYAMGQDPTTMLRQGVAQIGNRRYEMGLIRSVPRENIFGLMGGTLGEEGRLRTEVLTPAQVIEDYSSKKASVLAYDSVLNEAVSSIGGGKLTGSLTGHHWFGMRKALPDSKTFYGLVLETVMHKEEKLTGQERDERYDQTRAVVRHQLDVGGFGVRTRYSFEGRGEEVTEGKMTPGRIQSIARNSAHTINQVLGKDSKVSLLSRYNMQNRSLDRISAEFRSKQNVGAFLTDQQLRYIDIFGLSGLNLTAGLNYIRTKTEEERIAAEIMNIRMVETAYGLTVGPEWYFEGKGVSGRLYSIFQKNWRGTRRSVNDVPTYDRKEDKVGYEIGGKADWNSGYGIYGRFRFDKTIGYIDSEQWNLILNPYVKLVTKKDTDVELGANLALNRFESERTGYQDIAFGLNFKVKWK